MEATIATETWLNGKAVGKWKVLGSRPGYDLCSKKKNGGNSNKIESLTNEIKGMTSLTERPKYGDKKI